MVSAVASGGPRAPIRARSGNSHAAADLDRRRFRCELAHAGNWSSQPVAGNLLSFEGSQQLSNINNYAANTQFGGITFNSGSGAFSLNGNAISLAGDIVNTSGAAQAITLNLGLAGASRTINTATANLTLRESSAKAEALTA